MDDWARQKTHENRSASFPVDEPYPRDVWYPKHLSESRKDVVFEVKFPMRIESRLCHLAFEDTLKTLPSQFSMPICARNPSAL